MAHDASATWSGFNYQGKVGLYHALNIMNKELEVDSNFDFSAYELVYENHEDFDIKIKGEVKSIHQVKAYNSTTFSDYSNAILETILEIHTNNSDTTKCFLHTWKPIDYCENKIRKKFKLLNEKLADKGIRKDSPIEEAIKKLRKEDIVTKKGSKKKKISGEHAKLIKNKYEKTTVEKTIESINKLLEDDSAISRFKIYKYSAGENCCELDAINEKVTFVIQTYLQLKELPCDETIIERCFSSFLGYIDNHIIQRHLTIEKPKPISISFIDLSNIIERKDMGDASNAVTAYIFKQIMFESLYMFIEDGESLNNTEYSKYYSDKEHSYLESCIEKLQSLSANDLLDCYRKLSPQLNQQRSNIHNAYETDIRGIRRGLFIIFSRLNSDLLNKRDNRLFYTKDGKHYLPTSITDESKNLLAKAILTNPNLIENTFDISTFIGGENCPVIDDFIDRLGRVRNIDLEEFLEHECHPSKERIMKINRNLRLVPIQDIIGEIND